LENLVTQSLLTDTISKANIWNNVVLKVGNKGFKRLFKTVQDCLWLKKDWSKTRFQQGVQASLNVIRNRCKYSHFVPTSMAPRKKLGE